MAAEICVTKIAIPAFVPADRADPPLKPNQPTQSIDAPIIVKTGLCGGLIEVGNFLLEPITTAVTKAPTPAVACTTRPPAKSKTFHFDKIPPPHTQCVTGAYTIIIHKDRKIITAKNFILSTKAPIIRAGVIIANVIWKPIKVLSGIVPLISSYWRFVKNIFEMPPIQSFPSENAKE